jgi:hypothetical protein
MEWSADPGDKTMPDSVKNLQWLIVEREITPTDSKAPPVIDSGFTITNTSLTGLIESLAPDIENRSRSFAMLGAAPFGPGLKVTETIIPLPAAKKAADVDENFNYMGNGYPRFEGVKLLEADEAATGVMQIDLYFDGPRIQSIWLVHDGKAKLQATPGADEEESQADPIAAALTTMREGPNPPRFRAQIQILSRADLLKFKASNEEE